MDSLFDDDAVVLNTKALVAGISRHHSTASTHAESPMGAGQGAITNEYIHYVYVNARPFFTRIVPLHLQPNSLNHAE